MNRPGFLRKLPVFALALALGFHGGKAHADSPADLKQARAQFQRGIELEQASNWSEAIQQFREVGSVRMTPQVRFHIAYCEEMLGRLVTALGGYELALGEADRVGPDFKGEVETAIGRLRERIPKLVIERGEGAEAAAAQLDGIDLGASSIGVEIPLDPGPHTVTATAPGYKPFSATAEAKEREVTRVTLTLELEPVPDPRSAENQKQVIVVAPPEQPKRLVPYVIGGTGVAFLITGGVLLALRQSKAAELEKNCPDPQQCPESNRDTYDQLKFYNWSSAVAAGVGAAGVAVAVTLILFEKKPKSSAPTQGLSLVPHAPGADAGASFSAVF